MDFVYQYLHTEQIKYEFIQFEILREFVNLHKAIHFLCKTTPGVALPLYKWHCANYIESS